MAQETPAEPSIKPGSPAPKGNPPLDPFSYWRDALNQFEQQANALGNQSLRSPEVTKLLHQFASTSVQLQNILEATFAKTIKELNLPSRKDVLALTETVRALEEKLDRLLVTPEATQVPRPARTRQPAVSAPEQAPAAASALAAPDAKER
jgi:hypothetical protein